MELSRHDRASLAFLHYAVPMLATHGKHSFCWRCLFRIAWAMHVLRQFR